MAPQHRSIDASGIDLYRTLKPLAFFPSDPTVRLGNGRFQRATITPEGPASIDLSWTNTTTDATAFGEGAIWLLDRLPQLIGAHDDASTFDPTDRVVRQLWRTFGGLRICASGTVWHDLAWLVPGQRVATVDAARQWAKLVRLYGQPDPGNLGLVLPPTLDDMSSAAYVDLHKCGLERKRAEALIAAARHLKRHPIDPDLPLPEFRRQVEYIRGSGQWMSTNLATMTAGHVDEVVLGDYGLPSFITWALARERVGTDERMLQLLAPFQPHRWRVCRLIMSSGVRPPRHGPRRKNPRIEWL